MENKNIKQKGLIRFEENTKDLPSDQLHRLFFLEGWSDGKEPLDIYENFNRTFINSTLVISAWEENRLVGVVRVLSDKIVRSIIYDLIVDKEFQNQGIGKELVKRCIAHFPNSEWLVETTPKNQAYYEKLGFKVNNDVFLTIPSIWMKKD